ncbi:hypothetical protein GCM10007276_18020 [Agaricicola taiwanensis]|uniref:Uncharacterized protein n=1 Tax=Agaricicola taiwanensis TaxID=591372 RepID=A0A8J2VUN5_9RHOB|nr:hypothetical protein GCM10007276_18020 [Agaricicola taiwanensis]
MAAAAIGDQACRRHSLLDLSQGIFGSFKEMGSSRRELDRARRPIQQPRAQSLFELANLGAEMWLGHSEFLGSASEVKLFRDGGEDSEIARSDRLIHTHTWINKCR